MKKTEANGQESKDLGSRLNPALCFLGNLGHVAPLSEPQLPHLDDLY